MWLCDLVTKNYCTNFAIHLAERTGSGIFCNSVGSLCELKRCCMKIVRKILLPALLSMVSHDLLDAMVMTRAQADAFQEEVLLVCRVPSAIQAQLDAVFTGDMDFARYLVDRPKKLNMAGPALGRLRAQAETKPAVAAELTRLKVRSSAIADAVAANKERESAVYDRHKIIDLAPGGGTAAITADAWNFVMRVPNCEWYDTFVSEADVPMRPSRYQNVSRVFYAKQINDFVVREGLDRVYPFKQWLWHIPGRPHVLSDENYLVVTEKIVDLPAIELNATRFQGLVEEVTRRIYNEMDVPEVYVKEEAESLVVQIVQVISYAALWDIKLKNIFLINHDGELKILFLDTEKPGLGGGADVNFYHTHEDEVMSNMRTGFEGLADIFLPDVAKKEVIKRANALDRTKFEAAQRAK